MTVNLLFNCALQIDNRKLIVIFYFAAGNEESKNRWEIAK